MANLAIKGHPTRGKEVIQLLEMLGGVNKHQIDAIRETYVYFVLDDKNKTICSLKLNQVRSQQFIIDSLEEFKEKYPYKVGNKVIMSDSPCVITSMTWDSINNDIFYYVESDDFSKDVRSTDKDLQPYEEEPDMVEDNYCETLETKVFGYKIGDVIFTNNTGWVKITNKLWDCYAKEHTYKGIGWINEQEYDNISHKDITGKIELDKVTDKNNYDINCPDGYEFYDDNGNLISNKIIMRPKKPTYPKTYEECCEVLGISRHDVEIDLPQPYQQKMFNLFKLHICRDAYWKIAGEQMGLGKPWEPDWNNGYVEKYYIYLKQNEIEKSSCFYTYHFLAFPTAEMRDAFCENFKDLINECKELL